MALESSPLAAKGSSGNNTHNGVHIDEGYKTAIVQFITENAGTTVTWKVQGSLDSTTGADGNWFDIGYVTDATDTLATAARTQTVQGAQIVISTRYYAWLRLVTSANTGFTYHADVYIQ